MKNLGDVLWPLALIVGIGGPCAIVALVWDRPSNWRRWPRRNKPQPDWAKELDRQRAIEITLGKDVVNVTPDKPTS